MTINASLVGTTQFLQVNLLIFVCLSFVFFFFYGDEDKIVEMQVNFKIFAN